MLKLTSLALAQPIGTIIGLLTVIAIAPKSEAMTANAQPISLQQPAGDLHAQVIFKIGTPEYRRREAQRRRELLQRQAQRRRELLQRQAERRREANRYRR